MGRHSDKAFITASEWAQDFGGAKSKLPQGGTAHSEFRRLPYDCCAISLRPFENPVCTKDGTVFDIQNVVPFIKKFGIHPVTGEPLETKALIRLHFHKNQAGEFHCPVTFKVFNEHTHIVAIKTSGNVYSYDAIERLNIKPKNFHDLLDNTPFKKPNDIITIQNPLHLSQNVNLSNFHHLKNKLKVKYQDAAAGSSINVHGVAGRILDKLQERKTAEKSLLQTTAVSDTKTITPAATPTTSSSDAPFNAAHFSQNQASASLTSTSMTPILENKAALINEDQYMYDRIKTKGYVQISTNFGDLNVELFCDQVPQTCHNFILLAKRKFYDGTQFHRNIKGFMIQGGDPEGTGKGGESAWGKPFKDEFKGSLTHSGRGILSMANRGPNTNNSQFFITYGPCSHLDAKHSVFGKVVGGLIVLDKMERVPTDQKDRPTQKIKIESVSIYEDPFEQYHERLAKKLKRQRDGGDKSSADVVSKRTKVEGNAVGKYLNSKVQPTETKNTAETGNFDYNVDTNKESKKKVSTYGNFSQF